MEDKRLVNRIISHWNGLRKNSPMPQWEQLNTKAIDDMWSQCCVWRVEIGDYDTPSYTYEYVGKGVREVLGDDPAGVLLIKQFRHFPGARVMQKMDDVVKNPSPFIDSAQFIDGQGKIIKCRSCLLPFGNKQGKVTRIVLAVSWGAFE